MASLTVPIPAAATSPIGDVLFSKTRRAVLAMLFGQPERSFYTREVVAAAQSGASQVQKELDQLARAGLILRQPKGNQVWFKANPQSPVFAELKSLVSKTFGIKDVVQASLAPFADRIALALIYGSVARGEHHAASDVDVLIAGDVLLSDISPALDAVEQQLARPINVTLFTAAELRKKLSKKEHFVRAVWAQPMLPLIGDPAEFARHG